MLQNPLNLMKYAIDYLSKYNSSKANLQRILKNKIRRLTIEKKNKYLLYNSIEKIIDDLEKNNYLNDNNYAYSKIGLFYIQGKSKIFIQNYFYLKGIDKDIINKTFEKFQIENYNWEIESAKIFAKKKRLSKYIDNEEKCLSRLARAGFSYDISREILNDL